MSDKDTNSPAFSLNVNDVLEITKNTALVALAAGLTYFGENMADLDLGNIGVMLVPIAAVVINTCLLYTSPSPRDRG